MSEVVGTGRLVVDSSVSTGDATAGPGPSVEVAGQSHTATWRTWSITLPAGHYPVRVTAGGRRSANLLATVHAGQDTTLHYRATGNAVELRHTPMSAGSNRWPYLNMAFGATVIVLALIVLLMTF